MTAGEFIRRLTEGIHNEGYTANNVNVSSVEPLSGDCYRITLEDRKDNEFEIYIENN